MSSFGHHIKKSRVRPIYIWFGSSYNIVRKYPDLAVPLFVAGRATPEEVLSLVRYEDIDHKPKAFFQKYVGEECKYTFSLLNEYI